MEASTTEIDSLTHSVVEMDDSSSDDQRKTQTLSDEGVSAVASKNEKEATPAKMITSEAVTKKSTMLMPMESYEDISPVQYPTIRRKDGKASKFHVYCTACKREDDNGVYYIHPLLHLPICTLCNLDYHSGSFELDEEGENEIYCRWCGQGQGDLLACDTCPKSFCSRCLGEDAVAEGLSAPTWSCLACQPAQLHALCERNHWLPWKITALRALRTLPRSHRMPPRSSKLKAREVVSQALGLRQQSARKRTSKVQSAPRARMSDTRSAPLKPSAVDNVVDEQKGRYRCFSTSNQQKLFVFPVPPPTTAEPVPERRSKPTRNLRKRKNASEEKPLVVPYHLNVAEARSLPGRLLYCTACKCPASANAATKYFVHPLLHVPVCVTCHRQYMLGEFVVEDGNEWFCRWCGQGQGALFLCDTCPKSFCSRCLGANEIQRIRSLQGGPASSMDATLAAGVYSCYCCDPSSFDRLCDKNAYWLLWRDIGRRLWDAAHAAKLQRQESNPADEGDEDEDSAMDLVTSEDTSWEPSSVEGSRSGDSYRPSSSKAIAPPTTHGRSSRRRSKRPRPSAMSLLPDHVLIAHASTEKAQAGEAADTGTQAKGREDRFLAADAPAWTHFLMQHRQHPSQDAADGGDLQTAMSFAAAAVFRDAAYADDDDSSLHSLSSGRASLCDTDPQDVRVPVHQLIPRAPPSTALSFSSSSSSQLTSTAAEAAEAVAVEGPAAFGAALVTTDDGAVGTGVVIEAESAVVDGGGMVVEETPSIEAALNAEQSSPPVVDVDDAPSIDCAAPAEVTTEPVASVSGGQMESQAVPEESTVVEISEVVVSPPQPEETPRVMTVESIADPPASSSAT